MDPPDPQRPAGARRARGERFPNGEVRDVDLAYDYDNPSTDAARDFLAQFNRINRANQNRVWLTESAERVDVSDVVNARSIRCSSSFGVTPPPECRATGTRQSDSDLAWQPFGSSAVVTRLRADLNATSLDRDLQLAASDGPARPRAYNYGTLLHDPCGNPRSDFEGCSTRGRAAPGELYLAGLATAGLVATARTRRRRRARR